MGHQPAALYEVAASRAAPLDLLGEAARLSRQIRE